MTAFHYQPEVFDLLADVIPLLNRSKSDVFVFFRGSGVPDSLTRDLWEQFQIDKNSVNKYLIARTVLNKINKAGDSTLACRRELLKRVVEREDFSTLWPDDQLKAKGLVAELRRVVHVKDSFTRMRFERDEEVKKFREQAIARNEKVKKSKSELEYVKRDLFSLFSMHDPHKRGIELEKVLNRLFRCYDVLIRENFRRHANIDGNSSIAEQIDGVIEFDGNLYLVEMKWEARPIGKEKISPSLVNVFNRGHSRGIIISSSGFTQPAIQICQESLHRAPFCLVLLEEIVYMLENEVNLKDILRPKIQAALVDKNPLHVVKPRSPH